MGVDLSPEMIERARALGAYTSLHTAEVTAYLTDQTVGFFDVIGACDTFIYFGNLGQVIGLAARRLTPGGILAFTVERGDTHPFRLTDSGRFSHHARHVRESATDAGLSAVEISEHVLRYEYGQPVTGLVAVFASPSMEPRPPQFRQPGSPAVREQRPDAPLLLLLERAGCHSRSRYRPPVLIASPGSVAYRCERMQARESRVPGLGCLKLPRQSSTRFGHHPGVHELTTAVICSSTRESGAAPARTI